MKVQIRKATPEDASRLATILRLAMAEVVDYLIGSKEEEKAIKFLTYLIAQPDNQYSYENIWVAEVDGDILGQACLYDGTDLNRLRTPVLEFIHQQYQHSPDVFDETASGEIYLDTIAVASHAQGMGIGKLLLQHIIDFYVRQRKATIGLLVDKENPKAKSLYLNTGFSKISEKSLFGKQFDHLQINSETADH
ncbi:GNAT family N-acetyltransferase [Sphingobacterium sp. lm-10]|uniref:GNAT family N-acetyltransferase n=1 Tax=Sphingobacterium sp. lm-10 TaxID=2944904 RepID=UPI0020205A5D|nr:GNAT family N-acetyltransferase [Sphingobacterium sp. lm-10]MCL7987904.1 GNAT family N-acetyltransferase [Sphingobacterium sp. lm-10]